MADAKLEVAGEKCDLRLQLRQKREESREKPEVTPKKLENPPWDILVGSLWWVFGAFLPPRGKFWDQGLRRQPPEIRGQSVEKDVLAKTRCSTFFGRPEGGGTTATEALVPPDLMHRAD